MLVNDEMIAAAAAVLRADIDPSAWPTDDEVREALEAALAAAPQWIDVDDRRYEELRALIDGGSESMTHADAIEAVQIWREAYAAPAAPQWIACSERMPADCETVLVASQAATFVMVAYVGTDGQWRNLLTGTAVIYPVSHWMPLPAAPREQR